MVSARVAASGKTYGPYEATLAGMAKICAALKGTIYGRNNPNTKVWLCQTIGGDNWLKGSCAGYANPRGFPW